MKIRVHTLWRVPIYCMAASILSYYFTIYIGRFFFIKETIGAYGVTKDAIDPSRLTVFHIVFFIIILLLGGLWAFRSMTKPEIAVSAAILSALYLVINLAPICIPDVPMTVSLNFAPFQEWSIMLTSVMPSTGNLTRALLIADFAPFLFIPFGKKSTS